MRFVELPLRGAYVIEPDVREDERGGFARTWCHEEFALHGMPVSWVQASLAINKQRGTLRGLHYQAAPHAEAKLIRCTRGAVHDVLVDLRPTSPTYLRWTVVELSADNRRAVFIPEEFAHGYQTLTDDAELHYLMSEAYYPDFARGIRWNDPALGIVWPACRTRLISERDRSFPDYQPEPCLVS